MEVLPVELLVCRGPSRSAFRFGGTTIPLFIADEFAAIDSPHGPIVRVVDQEDGRYLITHSNGTAEFNGVAEIVYEERLFEIA